MGYFPFFVDIEGKRCVVAGAGAVAYRKVMALVPFGVFICVIAPEIAPGFQTLKVGQASPVSFVLRGFKKEDLAGADFVIAATNEREVNARIASWCRELSLPVDVADDAAASTFLFPALIQEAPVTVGICTGGKSPYLASWLKGRIREAIPQGVGELAGCLGSLRETVIACEPKPERRRQLWARLTRLGLLNGGKLSDEMIHGLSCTEEGLPRKEAKKAGAAGAKGKVTLVGAGPGDSGLITLKGLCCLLQADAVVYDHLAGEDLLSFTKPGCLRIYAGKEAGRHSMDQEEINRLLIGLAGRGLGVVRLKGGDPFVFGRGGEELIALKKAGIPYEVVAGVTSATAVPLSAGIPLTHRALSRQFHVITGHTCSGEERDFKALASLEGTLVFLMGFANLGRITRDLMAGGKSAQTPAAVIENGTLTESRTVRAVLGRIEEEVKKAGLHAPAVIVVGAVAALDLDSPNDEADYAAGKNGPNSLRVGIAGTDRFIGRLGGALDELGISWEAVYTMKTYTLAEREKRKRIAAALPSFTWLIFTSAAGVEYFFDDFFGPDSGVDLRLLGSLKLAVVGPGTGQALRSRGFRADYMPETFTTVCLAEGLCRFLKSTDRILAVRSAQAGTQMAQYFAGKGIYFEEAALYGVCGPHDPPPFCPDRFDYLAFGSAQAVRGFLEGPGREAVGNGLLPRLVCIGPVTARAFLKSGLSVITADRSDVRGVARAIQRDYGIRMDVRPG